LDQKADFTARSNVSLGSAHVNYVSGSKVQRFTGSE
jgi:hypothetical protein